MSMQSTDNETVRFVVPDMDCPSCAGKVEHGLGDLDAILDVETRPTSGTVVVTYDATSITAETITEALDSLGYPVTTTQQERFSVPSMDCSACAGKVDAALSEVSGVVSIDTRPTSGTVVVTYDPAQSSVGELTATIEQTGYAVVESKRDTQPQLWKTPRAVKTAIGAVLLLTGVVFEWLIPIQYDVHNNLALDCFDRLAALCSRGCCCRNCNSPEWAHFGANQTARY